MNATSIPAVYMRGGTSKGVFLHASDLPSAAPERDRVLLGIMGSPDPLQIDGMGGTVSSTSKAVIVEPGPGDAITYWFAQVGIDTAQVDWSGNCGNLTTAVGPFAIDEGLVTVTEPLTRVRLINGNTGVEILADVETPDGRAATTGDLAIAGVPGTGSPVVTRYLDPAGGVLGSLLPLGAPTNAIEIPNGMVTLSVVDAAHPNAFARLDALGEVAGRSVAELNADAVFLANAERARASATVALGRALDMNDATRNAPAVPRLMLVGPSTDADADVDIIAFSMGRVHRGLPMTGALCLAAAASIPGTVVAEAAGGPRGGLRIRHPLGITEAQVEVDPDGAVRSLGVVRTARRLMDGRVYPREY
ncbi:PrpF domain-containing protein [Microbacterium phyllosphaerae]|uniref:PrpF domain-containing protein n=1 Tax=Microbacterium phyllosphaerae TaxID=124798 RepID=UPI002169A141|nr:PrpF domain-containing protein [Microbacterium phyllosphaerae]MCS3444146.1 2-methylaconitate cis-trans-isomerase PrpF [Microbacterium phyllosphaerae]